MVKADTPVTTCAADEAELVRQAQADRAAFGALYDRAIEAVYRCALRQTGDHAAAQDVTAEAFRRALEALPRYRWQGTPFAAWVVRIAVNVVRERRRQHDAQDLAALPEGREPADDAPAALDGLIAQEERAALWQIVATLPLDYQRVLVLRYARDCDYAAIAQQMGKTPAAAKQIAYRALKALRAAATASGEWREREPQA